MKRNPAVELYRALLMLGIVTLHALQSADLGFSPLARWVEFCVDGFVFISGWYGIKFGWWKVAKLYGLALWCSCVYLLAKWFCFSSVPWSTPAFVVDAFKHAEWYWFINAYVVLMCLAPAVNVALEKESSRKVFIPLVLAVFGWSFLCMVPGLKAWVPNPAGFGSHTFFTLLGVYVVARIARLGHWDEKLSLKQLVITLAVLSVLAVCNLNKYNSPVAVLMGGVLFILFNRIKFGGGRNSFGTSLILLISPSMLAVYLLHGRGADFVFVSWCVKQFANPYLGSAATIVLVFIVCVLIDLMRRMLYFIIRSTFLHFLPISST